MKSGWLWAPRLVGNRGQNADPRTHGEGRRSWFSTDRRCSRRARHARQARPLERGSGMSALSPEQTSIVDINIC